MSIRGLRAIVNHGYARAQNQFALRSDILVIFPEDAPDTEDTLRRANTIALEGGANVIVGNVSGFDSSTLGATKLVELEDFDSTKRVVYNEDGWKAYLMGHESY